MTRSRLLELETALATANEKETSMQEQIAALEKKIADLEVQAKSSNERRNSGDLSSCRKYG
jgi:phage shock protein A